MKDPIPALLVAGDPRHGVVRLAREIAGAVTHTRGRDSAVRVMPAPGGAVHVHFTDRLWGATPALAAQRLTRLAAGCRLTVTLHDVPQLSDGAEGLARRRDCYRAVLAASAGVVCNSEHERSLLWETGTLAADDTPAVIPLPVLDDDWGHLAGRAPEGAFPALAPALREEVGLLGYVYPGKGHAEAIEAVSALPHPRPAVRALGGVSPGHESELDSLRANSQRVGVDFAVTGWLTDAELRHRARTARVPLAAHGHVSASGSINSWVAAGRIALVADSRYAQELERLRPGTIHRYAPARLSAEIAAVLAGDVTTFRPAGIDTRPHLSHVVARYIAWWADR